MPQRMIRFALAFAHASIACWGGLRGNGGSALAMAVRAVTAARNPAGVKLVTPCLWSITSPACAAETDRYELRADGVVDRAGHADVDVRGPIRRRRRAGEIDRDDQRAALDVVLRRRAGRVRDIERGRGIAAAIAVE